MKWGDLKGAFEKLVGGGRGAAPNGASSSNAGGASLDSLRDALRAADVTARVTTIGALAKLAENDPSQHWAVVDLLVGFVRDRCPYVGGETSEGPPPDVQAVIQALGRRRHADTERLPLGLFQVDLRKTDFSEARLERTDFSRSHLEASDFTGAALAGANFQEAYLDDAHFMSADLVGANFLAADLHRTNFTGATLRTVHFEEASMEGVVLVGARLDGAVLTGANLAGARLEGADLAGAVGVTREQLAAAVTDGRTVLPHLD